MKTLDGFVLRATRVTLAFVHAFIYRTNLICMPKTLCLCVLFLSFLAACNQADKQPKIKTWYYIHRSRMIDPLNKIDTVFTNGGITYTNHYGPDGKKDTIFSSDGSITTFSGDSNSTTVDRAGNIISSHKEFLSAHGTDSSVDMEHGQIKWTRKFIYDKDGNNIEQRAYEMNRFNYLTLNFTIQYEYKDGNIISEHFITKAMVDTIEMVNPVTLKVDTFIQKQPAVENINHFDFYYDKLNTQHGNSNSKNLVKTKVQLSPKMDTDDVYSSRYTFDDRGRVLTDVSVNRSGTEYDSSSYSYY